MAEEEGNKGGGDLPIFSEQLPAEVRDDPEAQKVLKELKDVPHLFQSYRELKGSTEGMVKIPTKDSPAEELHGFFTKLGKPDTPEGYELKAVDFGEENASLETTTEFITALKTKCHELNLSKGQAEQVYEWFTAGVKENSVKQREADKEANENAHKKLRDLWGSSYSRKMENAKLVILKYAPDDLKQSVEKAGLKNNPGLLVLLSRIGDAIGEDVLIKGLTPGSGPSTEAEKERERLKSKYPSMFAD